MLDSNNIVRIIINMDVNTDKITELLNDVLKSEFTTINQYWLFGLTLNHKSLKRLGDLFIKESLDERSHVEQIAKRILKVGGKPVFNITEPVQQSEDVLEMLKIGFELEDSIIQKYKETIKQLDELKDYASTEILSCILVEEEGHREWLQSQIDLINTIGKELYISKLIEFE
jgi:bacterioferritin